MYHVNIYYGNADQFSWVAFKSYIKKSQIGITKYSNSNFGSLPDCIDMVQGVGYGSIGVMEHWNYLESIIYHYPNTQAFQYSIPDRRDLRQSKNLLN